MNRATNHALDGVSPVELSQVTAPLSDSDRCRLAEFWAAVIAESGAEWWPMVEVRAGESRRARRVERQRADRLVRVLSTASQSAYHGPGVAA